jgi:hypothetical protein
MTPMRHLIAAYEALLAIPATDPFRFRNQHLYASIRDEIAARMKSDPETVQNYFEGGWKEAVPGGDVCHLPEQHRRETTTNDAQRD